MDMTLIIIGFFVIASILFMTFAVIFRYKKEKNRTAKFIQIANDFHMSTVSKLDRSFRNRLKNLQRFKRKPYGGFKNILRKNKNNGEILFFECYRGRRKNSNSHEPWVMEGIFYFNFSALNLPCFYLHEAEEFKQFFLSALGCKDINFERHPVFSKKYFLSGDDEIAVNKLFNEKLIRFLEGLDGFNIEGCDTQLIVYRPYVRIDPNKFKQLKNEAVQIFEMFRG